MDYFAKKQWIRIAVCVVLLAVVTLFMTGVIGGGKEVTYTLPDEKQEAQAGKEEPAAGSNDILSQIAVSMGNEKNNSYVTDYLEQDPYLVNIYEGYGFAKDYGSARGHSYTLEDVAKTKRPHAKANCLTCKTPDLHKMIAEQGVGVYSMPFDEAMAQMTQPISCYTCHGDDGGNNGQMVVTHQYVNEALGENAGAIKAASLSCGQCHIEYYFTPEDSKAVMPYHSVAEMTPEAILAYYDAMGFYDWEQPGTGTKMLKAQHPELETYLQGRHAAILSCADCHMPVKATESGAEYHDHHLVSPLNSETLLAKCAECHGSGEAITARVREIQAKVTGRETQVGNRLSALKDRITKAVEGGSLDEGKLEEVRKLHREAQWFFDYCYVENSEGAHNSTLAYHCLDTADARIDAANALLDAAGVPDSAAVPAEAAAPAAAETPTEKVAPVSGGYRIEKENQFGKVTVITYIRDGKIVSCKIIPEGENNFLKEETAAEWAKAIVDSGRADPDAISGATLTFSSGTVMEAVTEIMDRGGVKPAEAAVEPAAAPAEEPKAEEPETAPAEEPRTEEPAAPEPEQAAEPAAAEAAAPAAAEAPAEKVIPVSGGYRIEKENQFGKVTVIAYVRDGKIASCKIIPEGENNFLKEETAAEWAKAIVDSGRADPDAISGASLTFSSGTVMEAVTEIMDRGGVKPAEAAAEPAAAPAEEPKAEDTETAPAEEPKAEEPAAAQAEEPKAEEPEAAPAEEPAVPEPEQVAEPEVAAEPEATEAAAPAADEATAEKTAPVTGGYRVEKENQFGKVTVITYIRDGKIASCKIIPEGENNFLKEETAAEWAKAIVESGSAKPDVISGATLTFSAGSVTEAMTEIMDTAAGK